MTPDRYQFLRRRCTEIKDRGSVRVEEVNLLVAWLDECLAFIEETGENHGHEKAFDADKDMVLRSAYQAFAAKSDIPSWDDPRLIDLYMKHGDLTREQALRYAKRNALAARAEANLRRGSAINARRRTTWTWL